MSRAEFICSATTPQQYPVHDRVEVALAGRSNVGKSSLINAVTGVRGLARTAKKPGRTRTINFYAMNPRLALVDLPGYGYAAVSQQMRASWGPMIEQYLTERDRLVAIVLLLDGRHGPTDDDLSLWHWAAELPLTTYPLACKWDKVKRNRRARRLAEMKRELGVSPHPFSAVTGEGVQQLKQFLQQLSRDR